MLLRLYPVDDSRWWMWMLGSTSWCDDDLVGVDEMIASPVNVSSLENPMLNIPLNKIVKSISCYSCEVAVCNWLVGLFD